MIYIWMYPRNTIQKYTQDAMQVHCWNMHAPRQDYAERTPIILDTRHVRTQRQVCLPAFPSWQKKSPLRHALDSALSREAAVSALAPSLFMLMSSSFFPSAQPLIYVHCKWNSTDLQSLPFFLWHPVYITVMHLFCLWPLTVCNCLSFPELSLG